VDVKHCFLLPWADIFALKEVRSGVHVDARHKGR
jgi:hypothetical protein